MVAWDTFFVFPWITLDTVVKLTPASLAISLIVTIFPAPVPAFFLTLSHPLIFYKSCGFAEFQESTVYKGLHRVGI